MENIFEAAIMLLLNSLEAWIMRDVTAALFTNYTCRKLIFVPDPKFCT